MISQLTSPYYTLILDEFNLHARKASNRQELSAVIAAYL
jgi:hypothetical protein